MSSGLIVKAISGVLSSPSPPSTVPDEIHELIQTYTDKHKNIDDSESQRLHDDLFQLYQRLVVDRSERYATFLECLRLLRPAIKGADHLLEWWHVLLRPLLDTLGQEKIVLLNTRAVTLSILIYDPQDDEGGDRGRASASFAKAILEVYMEKNRPRTITQDDLAMIREDERSRLMSSHLESILLSWGKAKTMDFLMALEALISRSECRLQALGLLCTFIRIQPPHLHLVLQTCLIERLMNCLLIDTSTTVISLALTTLIMFFPYIPNSLAAYLPQLFVIYSRIICWDRLHSVSLREQNISPGDCGTGNGEEVSSVGLPLNTSWTKLSCGPVDGDPPTPDQYFTFLYGLYPLNFMKFVREPLKFLENAEFTGVDEIKLDPSVMRSRTERYRRVHLLHPNFYAMTPESELTDNQWLRSDPANVVAKCMGLFLVDESLDEPRAPPSSALPIISGANLPTERIPSQSLLFMDDDDSTLANEDDSQAQSCDAKAWLNPKSLTNASNTEEDAGARGVIQHSSYHSRKRSNGPHLKQISPAFGPQDRLTDSPTLPAHLLPTSADSRLQEMLQTHEALQVHRSVASDINHRPLPPDNVHQILVNESADSQQVLDSSSDERSLIMQAPRSSTNLASLQRQVMLLRNDLNFERFLKQQHLSHIGQLRRKYIRDDTVEAETQKLINNNKAMKLQLVEAKKSLDALRKETSTRQSHSRKWETELNSKIRSLREEHKQWKVHEETIWRELRKSRQECDRLRKLVVASEERELNTQHKMQSIELDLKEMETLRFRLGSLNEQLRKYQEAQEKMEQAKADDSDARQQLEVERLKFESRDAEREKFKHKYEQRIKELQSQLDSAQHPMPGQSSHAFQSMVDSALTASQQRFANLKKAHNHLLNRYTELEMKLIDIQAELKPESRQVHSRKFSNSSLHYAESPDSLDQADTGIGFRKRQHAFSDASLHPYRSNDQHLAGQTSFSFPDPPGRFEAQEQRQAHVSSEAHPGMEYSTPFEASLSPSKTHHSTPESLLSSNNSIHSAGSNGGGSTRQRAKIKAGSEVRVYGRGGVQNIGKRDKKEKDKKGGTLKSIRGFV